MRNDGCLMLVWFVLASVFFFGWRIDAATLSWGSGGTGGSGAWNTTNLNWWNGTSDVTWTDGGAAVFSGTGGTVALPGTVAATQLTFRVPGYSISGAGTINVPTGQNLAITADSDS